MFTWLGTAALGRALRGSIGVIVAAAKWFGQGLVVCVQHPVTFFVIIVAFGVGWGWGHHYGTTELRALNRQIAAENAANKRRADSAVIARREAEERLVRQIAADAAAPQEPPHEAVVATPAVVRARPAARKPLTRVRNATAVANTGSWLPSFLANPPERD